MKLYLSNGKTVVVASNGRLTIEPVTTTITLDGNVFVYKYPSGEQIGTPTHFSEVFQSDGVTSIGSTLALAQDYLIANTVFNTAPGGSGAPTAVIEISSAQILSMGSNPIELLPSPGVGKYILIDLLIFESIGVLGINTDYFLPGDKLYISGPITASLQSTILQPTGVSEGRLISVINGSSATIDVAQEVLYIRELASLNTSLQLSTDNSTDPTLGDCTMKAKIWYSIMNAS